MIRPGHQPDLPGVLPDGVVLAGPGDVNTLSRVIADAFVDLAPSQWLIPDPDARRDVFPGYFRILVEQAMATGVVHTIPDRSAVALWLPIGVHPPAPDPGYDARL